MYSSAFFTVPSRVLHLPKLTIQLLKFYEKIFQFWHHDRECFVSNKILMDHCGMTSMSALSEAFQYFEFHGEIKRVTKDGRRYIILPSSKIETDAQDTDTSSKSDLSTGGLAVARGGSRCSERGGLAVARDNNNNINNININKSSSNAVDQKTSCPNDVAAVASQSTKELVVQKGLFLTTIFANFKKYADEHGWKKDKNEWIFSFSKWVEQEKVKQDKNEQKFNEVKSAVPRFDESHPAWDAIHTKRGDQELGLSHLRSIKERFVKMGLSCA